MLLGVVSDTHGHVLNTADAVRMLESLEVEAVLHCGDIGSPTVVRMFSPWPTHFVMGNCDYDAHELRDAVEEAGLFFHDRFGDLEIAGVKIALLHSDDQARFRETIGSGKWDLVCYGHTHQARCEQIGNTVVLNPGAAYRANPHSLAVVELPSLQVTNVPF